MSLRISAASPSMPQKTALTGDPTRVTTGISGLDPLLDGGFPADRSVLVTGGPGTGKTMVALQFLHAGLQRDEPGIFISVDQKPQHVLEDAERFTWRLSEAAARGALTLLDASPYFTARGNTTKSSMPVEARNVATSLSQHVARTSARRLVIDGVTSLVPPELTRAQAHDYLRALVLAIEDNLGCTVLLTGRAPSPHDAHGIAEAAEYLVSGVLELSIDRGTRGPRRLLFIKKMRGSAVQPVEVVLRMDSRTGLQLEHTTDSRGRD